MLATIIADHGIEYALDVLEDGIDDGFGARTIVLQGRTHHVNVGDPMWHEGNDTIVKRLPCRDLRATRIRWATMGRTIVNVHSIGR